MDHFHVACLPQFIVHLLPLFGTEVDQMQDNPEDFADKIHAGKQAQITDNFMIIGIPNEIFGVAEPKSETLVFMVPRIIRTTKTSKHLEYNL